MDDKKYIYIIKFAMQDKTIATLEKDDECGIFKTNEDELNQILLKLSMDILSDAQVAPIKDGGVIPENPTTNIERMYKTIGISYLRNLVPTFITFGKYESDKKYNVDNDDNEKRKLLDDIEAEFGSVSNFMEKHLYKFTDSY